MKTNEDFSGIKTLPEALGFCDANRLNCQTDRNGAFDNKGLFPAVSNWWGRGPPGNERAADAGNVNGPQPIPNSNNSDFLARPEAADKGNLSARVERWMAGDTTAFDSPDEAIAALNSLPPVAKPGGASTAGAVAGKIVRVIRTRRSRAETSRRWQRRRMLAATYPLPPHMAAHLTTCQMAYARIVASDQQKNGCFEASHAEAAIRIEMHAKTAERAQYELKALGYVSIEERRDPNHPNRRLPNRVRIIHPEWLLWLRMGPKAHSTRMPHPRHSMSSSENRWLKKGRPQQPPQPSRREYGQFRASG